MLGTPWKGYYLTAYGIAVKHGFVGTEEEWLASLKGEPGAKAQVRYNESTDTLEWKTEEDEAWVTLMSLSDLQTELEQATIAEAQMAAADAKEAAGEAANAAQSALNTEKSVLMAEKAIFNRIEEYGTVVNNAYVLGDTLYIATSDGKVFTAGNVRGPKGDTGDSGVHIGTEEPTDPEKNVWIDTKEMAELSGVQKALDMLEYTDEGIQVDLSDYAKDVDLAERDETAAGFVRNKTHYEYMNCGETVTGTVGGTERNDMDDGNYEHIAYVTLPAIALTKGKKYKVVLGTNTHIVTWTGAQFEEVDGLTQISVIEENEEYTDIYIYAYCPEEETPDWWAKGAQVSITPIENYEIKQLPERFIPDYISGKEAKKLHKDMYVIAPSDAPEKSRADLVLSGDAEMDVYSINVFFSRLEKRGKVVFLPGTVSLRDKVEMINNITVEGHGTTFKAVSEYAGFYIYGTAELKGVQIKTTEEVDNTGKQPILVEVIESGAKITDCRISTMWGTCIQVHEGIIGDWQQSAVKIQGNTLKGNTAVVLEDRSIMQGNTIIGTDYTHPVTVSGSHCVVTGNEVRSYTEEDNTAGLKGITVSGSGNIVVGNVAPVITDSGTGNVISCNVTLSE